ncbi:unnamed protein product [Leuciscus chuanchicus]
MRSTDKYEDVALLLRGTIKKTYRESNSLPWPPTADDLVMSLDELLPSNLMRFLTLMISGDADLEKSEKTRRLVLSISQDIYRAVTKGEWKLPKHILLCTTIRHLYHSKLLATILSRLSHCETYDFGLELVTALTKALNEVSISLCPQIITGEGNYVFHLEWDNLNKITTNIHGSNVVNWTGGIMIQEVKPGFDAPNSLEIQRMLPLYERNKTRSLKVDISETLNTVHIYSRVGPKIPEGAVFTSPTANSKVYSNCIQESTIDYFTPINQPFTEYSVIKELLKQYEEATMEVGQEYVLNTFDLGGCMKALPLIWKFPDEYEKHVVTPGPFHTGMNYMGRPPSGHLQESSHTDILVSQAP